MASTYVNDLRLNEMATGDASGTWGTTTNTNLELIGNALGYGTEAITTNADTHTSTVADGAADPARAMYIRYTGTLDSACTITIGPNTLKRVHIIENATSGSQTIIIKQGSGATVTIPNGGVSVVMLDGAGSGAAVINAFTDLNLAGTLTIAGAVTASTDVTVGDDLSLVSDAAVLGFGADTDVTLTHVADTGLLLNSSRQLQFGDSGTYIHQSADGTLDLVADTEIEINATTIDMNGALNLSGNALVSGEVQTANIGYTDGDNAITIADGGGITAANGITSTAASNTFGATSFNDAAITNVGDIQLDSITGDGDTNTSITFSGSDTITVAAAGANQVTFKDGAFSPVTDSDVDLGTSSLYFKDAYIDTITTTGVINAASLDISGDIDVDGTTNLDIVDIDGAVDMASTLTVASTITGQKLTSTNGVLELDDNGSHNGVINSPASLRINVDSDNGGTGESFQVGHNQTAIDSNNILFKIEEDGAATFTPAAGGHAVFNEGSIDADFRIESNDHEYKFFVDAAENNIGIGTSSPAADVHIKQIGDIGNGNTQGLMLETGAGSQKYMLQTGRAGVANTYFNLRDVTNTRDIFSVIDTDGKFQGHTPFEWNNAAVFNEGSQDYDFRVESNANTHALFVDAGNSRVGINQSAPAGDFHVTGGADSLIFIDGTTSVANSATTLFTISLPSTANAVHCTLFVHGIASGVAWLAFKQDFVAAIGSVIATTAGSAVETSGGGTMTLNVSSTDLNVQFHHGSSSASTVNWSAVIQGRPGGIS